MNQLFSQYLEPSYQFVYGRVGNTEDAERITEELFVEAAVHLDRGTGESRIAEWLQDTVHALLEEYWDDRNPPVALSRLDSAPLAEAVPSGEVDPAATLAEHVLSALSAGDREVIVLRVLRGCSLQETASRLGATPQQVKLMQRDALARALALTQSVR